MPHRTDPIPMPASREPVSLLGVERALSEMRRGRPVAIRAGGGADALAQAAEAATDETLVGLGRLTGTPPTLALTGRRAAVLGLAASAAPVVTVTAEDGLDTAMIHDLADPLSAMPVPPPYRLQVSDAPTHGFEAAAVGLAKLARLLPAALTTPISPSVAGDLVDWAVRHDLLLIDAGDIFQYEYTASRRLRAVSEARVPLADAGDTRIIAFRPIDGGLEHLAIIVGTPDPAEPVLTRLHSECFTGDLLGSLRCDCGDQLRAAIREIGKAGSGILIYLAQEGRGIGLVNKLRAYELQDRGFDTVDANEQLGFDADERVYLPAAHILQHLGFDSVRLMTNNPEKVAALGRCGITVAERVAHAFPSNKHNEVYLRTKRIRSGHLF